MKSLREIRQWLADCERYTVDVTDAAPVHIEGSALVIDGATGEDGMPCALYLEIGGKPADLAALPLFDGGQDENPHGARRCSGVYAADRCVLERGHAGRCRFNDGLRTAPASS